MIDIPKNLGDAIDLLYKTRADRLALNSKVKELQDVEAALSSHILAKLDDAGLDAARGKAATFSRKIETKAVVEDWEAFYRFAVRRKDFSLLYKQASITALKERWDEGKKIPGVAPITVTGYSLTKASK